jgi:hypothetical protein
MTKDDLDYLSKHGGLGKSKKLSDTAFWLELWGTADRYINLLDNLDQTKDPMLLLPYLNVPEEMRPHFEDLFTRLKFKSVNKRTPSYQLTDKLQRVWIAVDQVRSSWRRGVPRDDAITKAAHDYRLDRTALVSALEGISPRLRTLRSSPPFIK